MTTGESKLTFASFNFALACSKLRCLVFVLSMNFSFCTDAASRNFTTEGTTFKGFGNRKALTRCAG